MKLKTFLKTRKKLKILNILLKMWLIHENTTNLKLQTFFQKHGFLHKFWWLRTISGNVNQIRQFKQFLLRQQNSKTPNIFWKHEQFWKLQRKFGIFELWPNMWNTRTFSEVMIFLQNTNIIWKIWQRQKRDIFVKFWRHIEILEKA